MTRDSVTAPLSAEELFEAIHPRGAATPCRRVARALATAAPAQVTATRAQLDQLRRVLAAWRAAELPPLSSAAADALIERALAETASLPRAWLRPMAAGVLLASCSLVAVALLFGQRSPAGGDDAPVQAALEAGPSWSSTTVSEQTELAADERRALTLRVGPTLGVELLPGARIKLEHSRTRFKQLAVQRGTALVAVHGRAADERVRVRTPQGIVKVTGTLFSVTVEADSTRVAVLEGRTLFVTAQGRQQAIVGGSMLTATRESLSLQPMDPRAYAAFDRSALAHPRVSARRPAPAERAQVATVDGARSPRAPSQRVPTPTEPPAQRAQPSIRTEALAEAPIDPVLRLFRQGEQSLAQGNAVAALRHFETVLARHPGHALAATAAFEIATVYEEQLGDPRAALAGYQRYLRLGPRAPLFIEAHLAATRLARRLAAAPAP